MTDYCQIQPSIWTSTVVYVLCAVVAIVLIVQIWRIAVKYRRLKTKFETEKEQTDCMTKFVKGISNELSNTLSLVLSGIEDLIAKSADRDKYSLSFVENNTKRGIMLTNELLGIQGGADGEILDAEATVDDIDRMSQSALPERTDELLKKVNNWIETNIANTDITVDMLANYMGMGRTTLYNKIKALTGKSPVELIQDFRLEKAVYYLKIGQMSVSEISYMVGFSDPGYFSRTFKKHFGISPSDYTKVNKIQSI